MIDGTVFCEKFWVTIARIMRVREAEEDEKRALVVRVRALIQIVEHLVGMPGAAFGIGAAAFVGIFADGELFVGIFIAVADLTGAHRGIAGSVEHGGQRVFLYVRWAVRLRAGANGQVPEGSATHQHMAGRRTDGTHKRSHVVRVVEDHAFGGEPVERWSLKCRARFVDAQIKRRLVVNDNEKEVGPSLFRVNLRKTGCCQHEHE